MTLNRVGTLPVSAINLGVAAAPPALQAEVAKLQADVSGLTAAITTQLEVQATFPPNIAGYLTAFSLVLDPSVLTSAFSPANWLALNADANVELVAELAFIEAQIAIVAPVVEDLEAGLTAPGLAGWTYAGDARGFGAELEGATVHGTGAVNGREQVSAIVLGSASFSDWATFGTGFRTGPSSDEDLPDPTRERRLRYQGALSGGEWSGTARDLLPRLRLILEGLQGSKAAIEEQIAITVGLNLPDPSIIVDAGLEVDLVAALGDMVDVQADLGADIGTVTGQIDAILDIAADVQATLSGGGLTLWTFSGELRQLGAELAEETRPGLPGVGERSAPAYGLVIAAKAPEAWADFGLVMRTEP